MFCQPILLSLHTIKYIAMKKYQLDLKVVDNVMVGKSASLLTLTNSEPLPPMQAGQFAELLVDKAQVLLRRPISIHNVNRNNNTVEFLIQIVGTGTKELANLKKGDSLNVLLPLGNGFDFAGSVNPLLIGGGVGVAPLLYLGEEFKSKGITPTFLFGGRSKEYLLRLESFEAVGRVYATTEDGSFGEKGYVTNHSLLIDGDKFDKIFACGPTPMLKAVAAWAKEHETACEVSLEHKMACGIGACLCCVEDTKDGHVCVCKEGPVFSIDKLLWKL